MDGVDGVDGVHGVTSQGEHQRLGRVTTEKREPSHVKPAHSGGQASSPCHSGSAVGARVLPRQATATRLLVLVIVSSPVGRLAALGIGYIAMPAARH